MTRFALTHLTDEVLSRNLPVVDLREQDASAVVLAHVAEFDARKLYLPQAYPSMHSYCVHVMHRTEEVADKLIRVARTAYKFPAIFPALAEGRLRQAAVIVLASKLTPANPGELIAAATHQSKSEIARLLAQRFPRPDIAAQVTPMSARNEQPSPGTVEDYTGQFALEQVAPRTKVMPLAPERFGLQFTIDQATYDKLKYAQGLASHSIPAGDLPRLFDQALDTLIHKLERRKFAATTRPRVSARRSKHPSAGRKHVPAQVKRAVWERDGGQCTFVSETGHRCAARSLLEYDHADPVALGGETCVARMRLRCRAHNQYTAECEFGADFMKRKRDLAREAAAQRRSQAAEARAAAEAKARAANPEWDVVPWLRRLGFRAEETRRAAEYCETLLDASLEERVRAALAFLGWNATHRGRRTSNDSGPRANGRISSPVVGPRPGAAGSPSPIPIQITQGP